MDLDVARMMLRAVEGKAEQLNIRVASCVVDEGGNTVAFERMNGTQLASHAIARGKAYTALAWLRPSGDLLAIAQPGAGGYGLNSIDSRFVLSAGGLPLQMGAKTIGALGVSGGTAEQDEECARAGVALFEGATRGDR